ncbi:MAG: allophanate hydrolase, partial [Staphylococcus epidermidis]|nr:allophanate hydrolase [Staphylococcus epidermidis]
MRTQFINEQTMMIYFENEISESTFKKVQQTIQYIKSKNLSEITNMIPSY